MLKLILNILFFIILAVFTAMNVSATTDLNLFGWSLNRISVVAVILVSIAVGILYSFIYYMGNYLAKRSKIRFRKNKDKALAKEKELDQREKLIQQTVESIPQSLALPPGEEPEKKEGRKARKLRVGRKKQEAPTGQVEAGEAETPVEALQTEDGEPVKPRKKRLFG